MFKYHGWWLGMFSNCALLNFFRNIEDMGHLISKAWVMNMTQNHFVLSMWTSYAENPSERGMSQRKWCFIWQEFHVIKLIKILFYPELQVIKQSYWSSHSGTVGEESDCSDSVSLLRHRFNPQFSELKDQALLQLQFR